MFDEDIDSVRTMLHMMNAYLKKLPTPMEDQPHNYFIEDSTIFINGKKYNEHSNRLRKDDIEVADFVKQNPKFIELAFKLDKNGITATIPYANCSNSLFYYRPTIEKHRSDDRFIAIFDSTGCSYLVKNNDTILDRYEDIILIADKSNPVYPTK